jgi:hypothetical protein
VSTYLPDYYATKLKEALAVFKQARAALEALPRELEQRIASIDQADLMPGEREHQVKRARQEASSRFAQLNSQAEKAYRDGVALSREVRSARHVDESAARRVRELLGSLTPGAVLDRAVEVGDPDMLAALRQELLWWAPSTDGFAEAPDLIARADQALADLGVGHEEVHNRAVVELARTAAPLPEITEFASKAAEGTASPEDRLRMAYAKGDGAPKREQT